ncbi:acetolactate synthase small subunit [Anaerobacillus alkaliphilus]|uniref:Acetolactate synthase small subunit n=1 Tax=Anaerobacillus alkaliphilus TaxID=1548597 RepID=A0A4Q0VQB3_9BACI|nr:acetolactate synthase small subunit [Anaerobacillus alkaliphilus]RXI98458.1 acetolactate synthase small subunit [Anaerobacillus alkaliphilus]
MKRIITATVNNVSGVLNRVTGMLARRHYNIESITVGHTENPAISRMTFVVVVDNKKSVEQVIKQLNKQVDVLKVSDITDESIVSRELALIKVFATAQHRSEIAATINPFRAVILDVGRETMTVQVTGDQQKVEALIELLHPFGIKELARTGITAFKRGNKTSNNEQRVSLIN